MRSVGRNVAAKPSRCSVARSTSATSGTSGSSCTICARRCTCRADGGSARSSSRDRTGTESIRIGRGAELSSTRAGHPTCTAAVTREGCSSANQNVHSDPRELARNTVGPSPRPSSTCSRNATALPR